MKKAHWISLKWKAVLLPSLLLSVIFVLSSIILASRLENAFEANRDQAALRYDYEVRSLLEESATRLQDVAELLPHMAGISKALTGNEAEQLDPAVERHWAALQLAHAVEMVLFFDASNRLLVSRTTLDPTTTLIGVLSGWAATVNATEQPLIELRCWRHCFQFISVPILLDGKHLGAVIVGRSLGESIVSLQQNIGKDIGLLIAEPDDSGGGAADSAPGRNQTLVAPWHLRVEALSDAPKNLAMLKAIAQQHPRAGLNREPLRFEWNKRLLELHFLTLNKAQPESGSYLVLIDDITVEADAMNKTVRLALIVSLLGLLAGVGMLVLILLGPTDRLKRMANLLPLLPEKRYRQVREALAHNHLRLFEDETDVLEATALRVTDDLERMTGEIDHHQQELVRRMEELALERDFNARLLDTAEVIILTLDASARILTMNRYASRVTEYHENELRGRRFSRLFSAGYTRESLTSTLDPVFSGQRHIVRHEASITTKSGGRRDIVWLHSPIRGHGAALLSIGLDITENRETTKNLNWLADHDALTGRLNRRRFEEQTDRFLSEVVAGSKDGRRGAALFNVDIDDFRDINEVGGQRAGDDLLRLVAEQMEAPLTHPHPILARLGGDEFGILLADTDAEQARAAAQRLADHLQTFTITTPEAKFKVSASVGVALIPEHGAEVAELLANAGAAKLRAKQLGRGLVQVYLPERSDLPQAQHRVYWRERIDQALNQDRFLLYFQPLLDIRSRAVHHYEVLIRMRDADGSVIAPFHFIPVAERSGQIFRIDRYVLEHAVSVQGAHRARGLDLGLAINLSAHAFDDEELPDLLANSIADHGANPSQLIFELTETAALSDIKGASQLMHRIRSLGCLFALDDFGVGFTSFTHLRELPVDIVKIDGAFVRDLARNPSNQTVVRALVDVARGFGKRTVAEFVDSEETLVLLESFGVDTAQGYFIGQPQPRIDLNQRATGASESL